MQVVYPPQVIEDKHSFSIFLAGTIDLGNSLDWQAHVVSLLKNHDVTIYNPRRPNWDNSIQQSVKDPRFAEQVNWEISNLENSDLIIMYLAKDSKSPISLLELGMFSNKKMIVFCAENFYRRGNVEIVCQRFKIPLFVDEKLFFEKLISYIDWHIEFNQF